MQILWEIALPNHPCWMMTCEAVALGGSFVSAYSILKSVMNTLLHIVRQVCAERDLNPANAGYPRNAFCVEGQRSRSMTRNSKSTNNSLFVTVACPFISQATYITSTHR